MKKEVIVILFLVFGIVSSINVLADEVGCCSNPGSGLLTCSTERLAFRDKECCPNQANFPGYYKSQQNPDNPVDYNACINNFFFTNKACSAVDACALGCCCSALGGSITSEAQCKGTGLTFNKGQTNCNQVCAVPQCSDGTDNDNNGCDDYPTDTGCASPTDNDESGGSCLTQGSGCNNPSYIPKLSNFEITPAKGQKKFLLKWQDECSQTAASYDVLRCKDIGCTNFLVIGTTTVNSFEDASADLLFDTTYTYQIKARYSLQTATPTITKTANLGNSQCNGQFSENIFCFGNAPYSCDALNKLEQRGSKCSQNQACIVNNNQPSCLNKINCNYNAANPFGLFYTLQDCETGRYCFYDRSFSTVDSCFSCDTSMACYDYKTEDACSRDNCRLGSCKWKNLADQIGIGTCVSTNSYNCQWCENKGTKSLENLRSFNEVFDFCTREKSDVLSEGAFKCYFNNFKSKNCNDVVCKDYSAEQCSNSQITHDENNQIKNPSADECSIRVCQNINNICVKNADGDNQPDCTAASCESDYFAPNTTLLPITKKGIIDSLIVQIYDKTSANSSVIFKTSPDYATFLCVEPCISQGHPYNASITSRTIIVSNLNAFDGSNGNKLLTFNEGANILRYYSQDPAKNIGEVKTISIEAHSNSNGPKVLAVNITDSSKVLDKFFTSNQKPTITVQFFEPAIVTFARLVNKNTGLIVPFQQTTQLNDKAIFAVDNALPNGEYTFELNAKNKDNIFMDKPLSQIVVIDNNKPNLIVEPENNAVINSSLVAIKLTFDKEVNLNSISLNSQEIKDKFSTKDNKIFTAAINLSDGNKKLEIDAADFAKNPIKTATGFIVDANPITINIVSPKFGTASKSVFDLAVETDNNAFCRYSLDNNLEFEFMDPFATTGGTLHTIPNFDKIASGDTKTHKLNVRCDDKNHGISFKAFDINVDTSPPLLKSAFAFPNPVIEKPSNTTLTVESDEPAICKFSSTSKEFGNMEGKFDGFDENIFRTINRQTINLENEGSFLYYAACENKAELTSEAAEIPFKVDLTVPISIKSHTPDFFNSTNAVLAVETNKRSQCKFSETDNTVQNGEIFGAPGYSHTRHLILAPGKHAFYIICKDQFLQKFSDVMPVAFTIDITSPTILFVNDSSTLENKPDFTFSTDSLRVKWSSIDDESRVSSHLFSLAESGTSNIVINWTTSYANNEWILVTKTNGSSLNLINGNRYFFRVIAQNIVGLSSNTSESDGISVDASLKPLNCTNGIKDDKETDVDCGGSCDLCELGKKCSINIDCKTNFCNNGFCSAPKCDDNTKNGDESDIDCGSSCKKCDANKVCNSNNDCASSFCSFGFCKPQESCMDSKLSPGESDTDCGGHCPAKCTEGKNCNSIDDCSESLQCISSLCKKCRDNDKNCNGIPDDQEETNAALKDTDKDGMPDEWEIKNGLNPNDLNDANIDNDKDKVINLQEYKYHTNPNLADTDGDGFTDKQEIDAGTNPLDPKDFPKSNTTKIILFILGAIILVSGFGYLAYKLVLKKREGKYELRGQKEVPKVTSQQPRKLTPLKQAEEEAKIREALKQKEEQKERERKKLFESFGRQAAIEKPEPKEFKDGKKPIEQTKKEQKPGKTGKKQKIRNGKPKEDAFSKLREISRETKNKKQAKRKNAK